MVKKCITDIEISTHFASKTTSHNDMRLCFKTIHYKLKEKSNTMLNYHLCYTLFSILTVFLLNYHLCYALFSILTVFLLNYHLCYTLFSILTVFLLNYHLCYTLFSILTVFLLSCTRAFQILLIACCILGFGSNW